MKYILILAASICVLSGCAYNQMSITNSGNGSVTCTGTVERPTEVTTPIQGNVPLNGGIVSNPTLAPAK